jgi:hypothetical protein
LPQLVLQALDVKLVAAAVGQDPRQQKHDSAGGSDARLREQERRTSAGKPLVPDELVFGVAPPPFSSVAVVFGASNRPASRSSPCR